jgi:predicted DNA-binding protein (MmcQ/YjbR family)
MSKKHWNTVVLDGSVHAETVRAWIDHSYELVVAGLSKRDREQLQRR